MRCGEQLRVPHRGRVRVDYQFGSPAKICAASGQPLLPGAECVSALVEQGGRLVRLDFLLANWTGEPPHTVGTWRFRVPEATAQQQRVLDTDTLLRFFEQLTEDANPGLERMRYVLALLLIQRRRLKLDGSRRDGEAEWLQFQGSKGEGPYEVQDQPLTADEITQLQTEMAAQIHAQERRAA